ncbi:DUF732 domain-containing protein [Rhodococcus sp. WS4]|nr:DUF732 domain-containing protein [Rhodococcus sp. WS4]
MHEDKQRKADWEHKADNPQPEEMSGKGLFIRGAAFFAMFVAVTVVLMNWPSIKTIFDHQPSESEIAATSAEVAKNRADNAAAASASSANSPATTDTHVKYTPSAPPAPTTGTGFSDMDAAFVQALQQFGIEISSAGQAVSTGKSTCQVISNSPNPRLAIKGAAQIARQAGGYTPAQANDFVGLAVIAYCPEYNDLVEN